MNCISRHQESLLVITFPIILMDAEALYAGFTQCGPVVSAAKNRCESIPATQKREQYFVMSSNSVGQKRKCACNKCCLYTENKQIISSCHSGAL